ncbi:MAG: DUF86 domain-containing protein [bacterium]
MTNRNCKLFIEDILQAMQKIEEYTKDLTYEAFIHNKMVADAVIRNIEIIGEAAKNIPEEVKAQYPTIPWKRMIGLRNITIHEYFGVDEEIIWEIITRNLPETKPSIQAILKSFNKKKLLNCPISRNFDSNLKKNSKNC